MTFKIYEVIDACELSHLRYRRILQILGLHIPLTRWRPCTFHRGFSKRRARHHCDMCAKYQGWCD